MNSSQLNFFIVPEDWPFIFELFAQYKVIYIRDSIATLENLSSLKVPYIDGRLPFLLLLTSAEYTSSIVMNYSEKREVFECDVESSFVIQFNRGGYFPNSDRVLHRGRFYCTTGYYARRGEPVTKGPEFKQWANKLYRAFKKEFLVKTNDSGVLFSQRTISWMNENNVKPDDAMLKIILPS